MRSVSTSKARCRPVCAQEVVSKFSGELEAAAAGGHDGWATPYDKLAAVIVADQLTRCGLWLTRV